MITTTGIFVAFLNIHMNKPNIFLERFTLLHGFISKNILLSFCLMVLFFTAAGIPPFPLFFAKINLIMSITYNTFTILLFVLFISAVFSGFYYVKVVKIMSFSPIYTWISLSKINYISSLILVYIIGINLVYFYFSSNIVGIGKYISLNINNI
jgi:NADH-quinone oxidoreductase subunit N